MRGKGALAGWTAAILLVASCASTSTEAITADLGLTSEQIASLSSLEQVDDHPLYVMHHYAPEPLLARSESTAETASGRRTGWACSLFAGLADPASRVFGRNFDWEFSPAVLLFNHPADGYESVAMVDIAYLGYAGDASRGLTEKPHGDLTGLLEAHRIPFDGMNEMGLVVAMAAVPETPVPSDPSKDTVDSLGVIRLTLDTAATVDDAIEVFRGLNVDFGGQIPLHYLVADATGDAAVIEYEAGEMRVLRSETGWLHATNFLLSGVDRVDGQCDRYDELATDLEAAAGRLDLGLALELLEGVAQPSTQWSIAYGMSTGDVRVAMGQSYATALQFTLDVRD